METENGNKDAERQIKIVERAVYAIGQFEWRHVVKIYSDDRNVVELYEKKAPRNFANMTEMLLDYIVRKTLPY